MKVVIRNKGSALREEMYVSGGQDLRRAGTSGIFHTGAKEAVASELLAGRSVVIKTTDDAGPYSMTFSTRKTSVGDCMNAHITTKSGTETVELTYTSHVGKHWGRPVGDDVNSRFKAVKEFVINAAEADPKYTIRLIEEEDVPEFAPKGELWIVMEWSEEIDELLADWPCYFKEAKPQPWAWEGYGDYHLPLMATDKLKVYPKTTDDEQLNVFVETGGLAFLAFCQAAKTTAFDYVLIDRDGDMLGRDRELRNLAEATKTIGTEWSQCRDPEALAELLRAVEKGEEYLEGGCYSAYYFTDPQAVRDAFTIAFGKKAAFHAKDAPPTVAADAKYAGARVIKMGSGDWDSMLASAGVRTTADAAGFRNGRRTRVLTKDEAVMVLTAVRQLRRVAAIDNLLTRYERNGGITYVAFEPSDADDALGYWNAGEIGIQSKQLAEGQAAVGGTVAHELVHASGVNYHDIRGWKALSRWLYAAVSE